jgi:outer membrane protein assembly factor BamB
MSVGSDCSLSLAWQQTVGLNRTSVSSPVVANGIVYFGDGPGGQVFAFDAATGARLWDSASVIAGATYATPTVVNGQVLVPSWDHHLHAFSP